ncbi:DNA helicase [Propionigenium maris DSM 9537]|uniref:DNA 3'-5' helicase n=1 Tax=Propionigenium maris DSM 9537 TaxID=1123000 RepID=A0A9W6GNM5_9FUSO|nr:ATP-dependent helicase [Propionigenium maris]GLI57430.1 DNA helicase [Propionigenium maris DSM 9537]
MKVRFREDQRKIMGYTRGYMGIPAVPGAGKTFILSHLVAKLAREELQEGEEILILTYMNSSVINFKERIREVLGEEGAQYLKRIRVITIHKLTSEILRENQERTGLANDYSNLTQANMYYLMSLAVNAYKKEKQKDFEFFLDVNEKNERNYKRWSDELVQMTLKLVSKCKNEDISPERLYSITKKYRRESILRVGGDLYSRYDKLCKKGGYLDYDDLLYLAYRLLKENKEVAERYRKKYRYILEDEAQDSNRIQNKILKLITNGNFVRVGDLNQSILATFTNSSPQLFSDYLKAHPTAPMFTAGRSSREICNLANFFVEDTRKNHPLKVARTALANQKISPVAAGDYPPNPQMDVYGIKAISEDTEYREMNKMAAFIDAFSKKYPEKRVAILFPKNYQIENAAKLFKKKGMKFQILADISERLVETLDFLGDLLLFLSRPYDGRKLVGILAHLVELDPERDSKLMRYLEGISMEKLFFSQDELNISEEMKNNEHWEEISKNIRRMKILLEFPQNSLERLLLFSGEIFNFTAEQQLLIEKVSGDLRRIFKLNPRWSIYDLAGELKKTRASEFTYLAKSVEEETEEKIEERYNITLTTYHKSKGMEWDMVWLFNVNSNSFPAYLSDNDYGRQNYLKKEYEYPRDYMEGEFRREFISREYENISIKRKSERIAECTRLIYVGITRAREYLILSCNEGHDNYYFRRIRDFIESEREIYEGYKKGE